MRRKPVIRKSRATTVVAAQAGTAFSGTSEMKAAALMILSTSGSISLKARLQSDLTESIRARDRVRSATLRMALTALRSQEVAGDTARELSDDEMISVLGREAKKRREAADAYDGANRPELADRERAERVILDSYLPAQLSDQDLTVSVAEQVAAAGASGMAAMGRVMKAVQPKVAGLAEGGRVAAEVRRQLGA